MAVGYAIIISERGRSHWQEYPNLIKPLRGSGMRFPKEVFNSEPDREPKGSHFLSASCENFHKVKNFAFYRKTVKFLIFQRRANCPGAPFLWFGTRKGNLLTESWRNCVYNSPKMRQLSGGSARLAYANWAIFYLFSQKWEILP